MKQRAKQPASAEGRGNGRCKCEGCGEQFYSLSAFDMHRVGTYAGDKKPCTRRCLSVAEMHAKGMRPTPAGAWTTGREYRGSREQISA